ncbi:YodC family protein [Parapedobacter soli]|uniref:YodC family protein n=1 Tax=Parapedobacter soli TaxID=416955 RepID=UPI0021CA46D1|nr:DUF2158 domain-containing protein [Parapedobacter soli]
MERKFKKGDVVQLKSGGPKMTISAFLRDDDPFVDEQEKRVTVFATWFEGSEMKTEKFHIDLIHSVAE